MKPQLLGRTLFGIAILVLLSTACGGNATVEKGGAGGAGGGAQACPNGANDMQVQDLVGKPCSVADEVCASNNGCGGCSVTCTGSVWTSTNPNLCYYIGTTC